MNTPISRWHPSKESEQAQHRLEKLQNRAPLGARAPDHDPLVLADWSPRVDILEDAREFLVKAELPEMKRKDVTVTVDDGVLMIAGERKREKAEKSRKFHRVEREYGNFVRSFSLPLSASGDKVSAEFKYGILHVHVPKDGKKTTKSVEIKVT